MENPLHHFELHRIVPIEVFGIDLSINQAVIMMWLAVVAVSLLFILGGRKRQLVPSKLQNLVEMAVVFLRQTVVDAMGPQGAAFLPLLVTLFFFILFSNLLGLIPGAYTATSQVMVTGVFALMVYVLSLIVGVWYHGPSYVKIFAPAGVPWWLLPIMVPIELVSQMARPVTLAVRLFANMTGGHTVILVFFGLMFASASSIGDLAANFIVSFVPALKILGLSLTSAALFLTTVLLFVLEFFIAFIQAYVFVLLTSIYVGEAIHLH